MDSGRWEIVPTDRIGKSDDGLFVEFILPKIPGVKNWRRVATFPRDFTGYHPCLDKDFELLTDDITKGKVMAMVEER